jgi:hypothetical protein
VKDEYGDLLADTNPILNRKKKFKTYKYPDRDGIQAELMQAGADSLVSVIHKFIHSIRNKKEFSGKWKSLLVYQFTRRVMQPTVKIIMGYHCYQRFTIFYRILVSEY